MLPPMPAASLPTLEQHLEARLTTALTERLSQASTVLLLLVSATALESHHPDRN